MKLLPLILAFASSQAIAAGGLTISNLPNESEETNPVCRDANGKLTNCTPNAGNDRVFLAPVAVDGNGHLIGTYLGSMYPNIEIVSSKNYRTTINEFDGTIKEHGGSFLYLTLDCTGEVYHFDSQPPLRYSVYRVNDEYYFSAEIVEITFFSNINPPDTICNPNPPGSTVFAAEVFPNDALITGLQNKGTPTDPYPLTIRLTRP